MCGITGRVTWNEPADAPLIAAMLRTIAHRGPDAENTFVEGPVALGHRRLAVLDTSPAANQPMADQTGRHVIVFNGEIYNYRDLQRELIALGASFSTTSDTEVVLEGFRRWGLDLFARLNGMFALAIWDRRDRRLILARDRLGKKPLFWAELPTGGVTFASEIKALTVDPGLRLTVSGKALRQFLSLGYVLGSAAIFEGVAKVPPGHHIVFEADRQPRVTSFWNLADHFGIESPIRNAGEAAEAVAALLDDAVQMRMISDVPLGAFLSGGLDSTAIVSAMCRSVGPANVHSFAMGFDEKAFDERPHAAAAAAFLGCHHLEGVSRHDDLDQLGKIAWHADEPFADTSILPTFRLAEFVRKHVTVALSGDGGDELFAGYETYVADRLRAWMGWLPDWAKSGAAGLARLAPVSHGKVPLDYKLRQFTAGCGLDGDSAHYFWRQVFSADQISRLILPDRRSNGLQADPLDDFKGFADHLPGAHYLDRAMYVDIKTWLVDDILVKVDRATMAHGLEARAPFLDYRLVELAAEIPPSIRMPALHKKRILKLSQQGRVPRAVLTRRKAGFNAPVSTWFAQADPTHLVRNLAGDWFVEAEVARLVAEHQAMTADHGFRLFALTMWRAWVDSVGKSAGLQP
ncbi:Asparagine synthetase [Magnetospirillum sp. LM-5]|uniref:asparagine synthase (glutamine-hydrolyzing) n=1 Tax=Magnetospirillum sp. LM-5 TaxID=2681466 RepID=UPI00137E0808|nr:asparagine synthase (glutamine-hydrolyzing) [Magnetospirillum sp. LM-5]CAA7619077.1 Asparagine synthetase [Magnetospirillum sp. LM-5]